MCSPRFLCNSDLIDIIGLIELLLAYTSAGVTIYGLVLLLRKHRNASFVRQRGLFLMILFIIMIIGEMIINRTYLLGYSVFFFWGFEVYPFYTANNVPPPWVLVFVYSFFWWTIYALNSLRIWNLYYLQQYNIVVNDSCWTNQIDTEDNLNNNWFIKYKNKWGSTRWLLRIFIPFDILCVVIEVLFLNSPLYFIGLVWEFIPLIFGCVILYKSKNVFDIYGLRNEVMYSTFIFTCYFFSNFITFILFTFGGFAQFTLNYHRKKWLVYSAFGLTMMSLTALLTVFYPIYWDTKMKKGIAKRQSVYSQITSMQMNEALKNELGFRLFMKYLIKEFSTESLLFIVELIQIKNYIQNINNASLFDYELRQTKTAIYTVFTEKYDDDEQNDVDENDLDLRKITLCKRLTVSPIIIQQENNNNEINIKQCMMYMYQKYVSANSKYPIAMAYEEKMMVEEVLSISQDDVHVHHENENEDIHISNHSNDQIMCTIYDSTAIELLYCLHDSFLRYQQSGSWNEYSKVGEQSVTMTVLN